MFRNSFAIFSASIFLAFLIQFSDGDPSKVTKIKTPNGTRSTRNPIYDFATNLYLSISKFKNAGENILISPFSIRSVSALIYLASRGQTADEIRNALFFPSNQVELIQGLAKQMASTQVSSQSKFDVANGIFMREGTAINKTYSSIVRNQLRSEIQTVPFHNANIAARQINSWVARITRDKIMNLVNPSAIQSSTSVFLANGLYFSGQWEKPFDEDGTSPAPFRLSSGKTVMTPMMQIEHSFSYNYIKELQASAISIPFKDSRFEFIILKPEEDLSQLESNMQNYPLNMLSVEIKKQSRSVFLKMPKFKLNVHYDLIGAMERLGIKTLFDESKADISGLSQRGNNHVVSKIVHQTVLDINEKGAAAAAATTISAYPISSPSEFVLDQPFLFLLNDRLTGPVFIGSLENPTPAPTRKKDKFERIVEAELSPR